MALLTIDYALVTPLSLSAAPDAVCKERGDGWWLEDNTAWEINTHLCSNHVICTMGSMVTIHVTGEASAMVQVVLEWENAKSCRHVCCCCVGGPLW